MNKAIAILFLGLMSFIQANVIHYHYHNLTSKPSQNNTHLREYREGLKHAPRALRAQAFRQLQDAQTYTYGGKVGDRDEVKDQGEHTGVTDEEASMVGDASWMFD